MLVRRLKIVIPALVCSLFLISVGGYFLLSHHIKSEYVAKAIKKEFKAIFPNARVKFEEIQVSFGFNASFKILNFSLSRDARIFRKKLLSSQEVELKTAVWSLLTKSGELNIVFKRPELFIESYNSGTNWGRAWGKHRKSIKLPAVVGGSKINLHFNNLKINYRKRDKKRQIQIDSLLVKNIGLVAPTAFKLNSTYTDDKKGISCHAKLIGQFDLDKLVGNDTFEIISVLNVSKIKLINHDQVVPDFKTDLKVIFDDRGNVFGDYTTSVNSSFVSSRFTLQREGLTFKDFKAKIFWPELKSVFPTVTSNIKTDKGSGFDISGSLEYRNGHLTSELDYSSTSSFIYLYDGEKIKIDLKGKTRKGRLLAKAKMSAWSGALNVELEKKVTNLLKHPYKATLKLSNMSLSSTLIRKMLRGRKQVTKTGRCFLRLCEIPGEMDLEWKNMKLDGADFSGKMKILKQKERTSVDKLVYQLGTGRGKASLSLEARRNKFSLVFKGVPSKIFINIMVDNDQSIEGELSGLVNGELFRNEKQEWQYDLFANLKCQRGVLKNISIGERLENLLEGISMIKGARGNLHSNIDKGFSEIRVNGKFTNKIYKFREIFFKGSQRSATIIGHGKLYPRPKKKDAVIYLSVMNNRLLRRDLKRRSKLKYLPVRLKGEGLTLAPDIAYTKKKLAQSKRSTRNKRVKKNATVKK